LDTCYKELSEQNGLLQSEYQSLNEAYEEKCNELCDELEKIRNCKEGYLEEIKRFQDTIGHANEEIESLRDHLERLGEQVKIAEYHGDERAAGLERELSQLVNNELKELEMLRQMIPALEGQFTQELQQMHEQHREQREQLRANMVNSGSIMISSILL
jgi:chromosome segregation ATPase